MTTVQNTTLAELAAGLDEGPLAEHDERTAAALGVPVEYFFAYEVVRGVLDARAGTPVPPPDGTRARALVDSIGWHAASACLAEDATGTGDSEAACHAARILGAVLELRQILRDAVSDPGRWAR